MPAHRQFQLHGYRGRGEGGLDVAIGFADDGGLAAVRRVEGADGIGRRHDDRQRLQLDEDQLLRIFGNIRVLGEDHRHRLADIAHHALRQDGLTIGFEFREPHLPEADRRNARHIGAGPDRHHAGHRERVRRVDGADAGMRHAGAHHPHVQLTRHGDVGGEAPRAA